MFRFKFRIYQAVINVLLSRLSMHVQVPTIRIHATHFDQLLIQINTPVVSVHTPVPKVFDLELRHLPGQRQHGHGLPEQRERSVIVLSRSSPADEIEVSTEHGGVARLDGADAVGIV